MADGTHIKGRYQELLKNIKASQRETAEWFKAAQKTVSGHTLLARNRPRLLPSKNLTPDLIGRMVMYFYDPLDKSKASMPYYDTFPLVIPINIERGGSWLGLNMHYISPRLRVDLLDSLYSIYKNQHLDETKRLRISYQTLQRTMRIRFFQPTVHRYKSSRLRSRIYVVDPAEWDLTLLLPTERFIGASKQKVWNDSRKKLRIGTF